MMQRDRAACPAFCLPGDFPAGHPPEWLRRISLSHLTCRKGHWLFPRFQYNALWSLFL